MINTQTAGRMPGRLRIFPGNRPVLELWLTEPRLYRIGRHEDCDLRLDDDGISRTHLLIDARTEPWQAEDPGSKNGSRIDGRPLGRSSLGDSCWLSLAGIPGRFERLASHNLEQAQQWDRHREQTASLLLDRLQGETDLGRRLDQLLRGFLELSSCNRGALLLGRESTSLHSCRLQGWDRFDGSRSVLSRTMEHGQATAINDVASTPDLSGQESLVSSAIKAVVCLPLKLDGEVRGALYGESERPGKLFTQLDVELMQALADQAMLLLGAESLRDAIQSLSRGI